jgi:hypothetical protein
VTQIGKRRNRDIRWVNLKEKDTLEDLSPDRRIKIYLK